MTNLIAASTTPSIFAARLAGATRPVSATTTLAALTAFLDARNPGALRVR